MLRELRAARYGHLLAIHVLLLCARGKTPTEIAESLLCSRSSVYRAVEAYRSGSLKLPDEGQETGQLIKKIGIRCSSNNRHRLSAAKRVLLRLLKAEPDGHGLVPHTLELPVARPGVECLTLLAHPVLSASPNRRWLWDGLAIGQAILLY
jgi:hypothetical protein